MVTFSNAELEAIKRLEVLAKEYEFKNLEMSEIAYYLKILKESTEDGRNNWGKGLNVLIVSDRCPGRSLGLLKYLSSNTSLQYVKLVSSVRQAKVILDLETTDILIFAGCQEDSRNYRIMKRVLKKNPKAYVVMYAHFDDCREAHCWRNNIENLFPSLVPVREFVASLERAFENRTIKSIERASIEITEKSIERRVV